MSIKFTQLSKVLILAAIASLLADQVKAEMEPLPEAFENAYFKNAPNAFRQAGIFEQINNIVGITGYPEQDVTGDGEAVDDVYQAGLKKQSATGMRTITRDLENPYDTSLLENPSYSAF
ncbi:MAG: serine/threonine protein kinase [Cyanobacteria bacterium P01_G01_bin.39]